MKLSALRRDGLLGCALFVLLSSTAVAENRLFIEPHTLNIGSTGVTLPVACQNDEVVRAFSLAIDYDDSALDVVAIDPSSATQDVIFSGGSFADGRISYGLVLDVEGGTILDPMNAVDIVDLTVDVLASSETTTTLEFADRRFPSNPDQPDELNVMVSETGRPIPDIGLENGEISIVDAPPDEVFRRGNANGDASVDISDASYTLNFLFIGGDDPPCPDAADSNDDGDVNISDASYTLNFLFIGGPDIPAPGPESCGPDETEDELTTCEDPRGSCAN